MTEHLENRSRVRSWRYPFAAFLILAALGLGVATYMSMPANPLSDAGIADLRRTVWLCMGSAFCFIAAGIAVTYEIVHRRDVRNAARSPVPRQEYLELLESMTRRARRSIANPVDGSDVEKLLNLLRPTGVLDAKSPRE